MSKIDWYGNENFPFRFSMCMPQDLPKDTCYAHCFDMLLQDCLQIIDIENMPETFDKRFFMLVLLLNGRICIFRDNDGNLRALNMKTADRPDIYYVPKKVLVTNPTFKGITYQLEPGKDCTVVFCTTFDQYKFGLMTGGLYSLISITATLLADNLVSINTAQKNMRLHKLLGADNQNTVKSIEAAMERMYYGRPFQVVQKSLLDQLADIPMQDNSGSAQLITQLVQANQYIKSQFFERIGFITHDQIKKERLITAELTEGAEMSIFNIMDMLMNIKKGIEETNELFGIEMHMLVNPLILRNIGITQEQFDAGDFMPDPGMIAALDGMTQPAEEPEEEEPAAADGEPEEEPAAEEPAEADGEPEPEPEEEEPAEADGEPEPEPEEAAADLVEAAADLVEAAADLVEAAADPEPEPEPEQEPDPLAALEEAAAAFRARKGASS